MKSEGQSAARLCRALLSRDTDLGFYSVCCKASDLFLAREHHDLMDNCF